MVVIKEIISVVAIGLVSLTYSAPLDQSTTTTEKPTPFEYSFESGRLPNGKPDRYVNSKGDESGRIEGSYTYLDPNWKWQTVEYVADPETGFHVVGGNDPHPKESAAVLKARNQHAALFAEIANRNNQSPVVPFGHGSIHQSESSAVAQKREEHEELFKKIAEEHAIIAAQHEQRKLEEEEELKRRKQSFN